MSLQKVWRVTNNLITSSTDLAGVGTHDATIAFGGYNDSIVISSSQEFNGYNWISSVSMNTARRGLAGAGSLTATISFGGYTSTYVGTTESFNGTTWTNLTSMTTSRRDLGGCGTSSAALSFGGSTGSVSGVTEEYSGISWSTLGSLNTSRTGLSGCGTQDLSVSFGGYTTSNSSVTETYNGSVWTNGNSMSAARSYLGGLGNINSATSFGGETSSFLGTTENFENSTWSTGNEMCGFRKGLSGSGISSSGISFGGTGMIGIWGLSEELIYEFLTIESYTRNFVGVTSSNDGTGLYPIAYQSDADLFPYTIADDRNTYVVATDADYTAISSNNGSYWTLTDPGSGDINVLYSRFKVLTSLKNNQYIKNLIFTFKGYSIDGISTFDFYIAKYDASDFGDSSKYIKMASTNLSLTPDNQIIVIPFTSYNLNEFIASSNPNIEFYVVATLLNSSMVIDYIEVKIDVYTNDSGVIVQKSIGDDQNFLDIINFDSETMFYEDVNVNAATAYYYRLRILQPNRLNYYSNILEVPIIIDVNKQIGFFESSSEILNPILFIDTNIAINSICESSGIIIIPMIENLLLIISPIIESIAEILENSFVKISNPIVDSSIIFADTIILENRTIYAGEGSITIYQNSVVSDTHSLPPELIVSKIIFQNSAFSLAEILNLVFIIDKEINNLSIALSNSEMLLNEIKIGKNINIPFIDSIATINDNLIIAVASTNINILLIETVAEMYSPNKILGKFSFVFNYELSIYSHDDEFIRLLHGNDDFSGQAYNVIYKTNINEQEFLSFSLPLYYYDYETKQLIENPAWSLIIGEQKIRLIRNKSRGNESIHDFVIQSYQELRENDMVIVKVECQRAIVYEISKIGLAMTYTDKDIGITRSSIPPKTPIKNSIWIDYSNKWWIYNPITGWQSFEPIDIPTIDIPPVDMEFDNIDDIWTDEDGTDTRWDGTNWVTYTDDAQGKVIYGDNNVYVSNDNGLTWELSTTLNLHKFASVDKGIVVATDDNNRIVYRSNNNGVSWINMGTICPTGSSINLFKSIGNGIVLAGISNLYSDYISKSIDYGKTWKSLSSFYTQIPTSPYQEWTNYPNSPILTSTYPIQCIVKAFSYSGPVLLVSTNVFYTPLSQAVTVVTGTYMIYDLIDGEWQYNSTTSTNYDWGSSGGIQEANHNIYSDINQISVYFYKTTIDITEPCEITSIVNMGDYLILMSTKKIVYISGNQGSSWSTRLTSTVEREHITVLKINDKVALCLIADTSSGNQTLLYKTIDGGLAFTYVGYITNTLVKDGIVLPNGQLITYNTISPYQVYYCTETITDWNTLSYLNEECCDIRIINNNYLLLSGKINGNIYRSIGGATWSLVETLSGETGGDKLEFNHSNWILMDDYVGLDGFQTGMSLCYLESSKVLCAGIGVAYIFQSIDNGYSWPHYSSLQSESPFGVQAIAYLGSKQVITCSLQGQFSKSSDYGYSWKYVYDNNNGVTRIVSLGNGIVLTNSGITESYIYKSVNYGSYWYSTGQIESGAYITDLVKVNSTGSVLASVYNTGTGLSSIYKSTSWGSSWYNVITFSEENLVISRLEIIDEYIILAGCSSAFNLGLSVSKIKKSTNSGISWSTYTSGLTSTYWGCKSLRYAGNGIVYYGCEAIYISKDYGSTWKLMQNVDISDKDQVWVHDIVKANNGNYLALTSPSFNIYRLQAD